VNSFLFFNFFLFLIFIKKIKINKQQKLQINKIQNKNKIIIKIKIPPIIDPIIIPKSFLFD
jgi:hypothetical protein